MTFILFGYDDGSIFLFRRVLALILFPERVFNHKSFFMRTVKMKILVLLFTVACVVPAFAQQQDTVKVSKEKPKEKYPQFQFKGLLQARYVTSLTNHVDIDGLHHTDDEYTSNDFDLKRVRLQVQVKLTKRTEVVVLANLADFKSDPKNKVLENAYMKYSFSPGLNLVFGQFRPWFGIEETYPVDVIKSMDYSNQYYEFAKNGWTSFQEGAAIMGDIKIGQLGTQYSIAIVNGNGRNQPKDKDNGKQLMSRLVFDLFPKNGVKLGLNGGYGKVFRKDVHALGIDLTGNIKFNEKWGLDMQAEAKQGVNHVMYYSLKEADRASHLGDYMMRAVYFLPNLRYDINYKNLSSIECSIRYEYMDVNYKLNPNPRHSFTPMISLGFLKNYDARIQLGLIMERYNKETDNTTEHNSNTLILQLQSRF